MSSKIRVDKLIPVLYEDLKGKICMKNELASELIKRFKNTCESVPPWACPYNPSIPLVGKYYKPGKGLLIYASAENLSWLNKPTTPERSERLKHFISEDAWNRYRVQYEKYGRKSGKPFPDVGIQPVNDGGLFAAGLFIAQKMRLPTQETPRPFLETIAVTNWCKFSIKSDTNRDYVANMKKLTASLPFVIGELVLLQPAVVLIPEAVWEHSVLQAAMRGASPTSKFLAVPQFTPTVVNYHLRDCENAATHLRENSEGTPPLALWMNQLKRVNQNNAWRYIAMLSERISIEPRFRDVRCPA